MKVTREELIAEGELTEFREHKADENSNYVVIKGTIGYKLEEEYDYENDPLTPLYDDLIMDSLPEVGQLFKPGDFYERNGMWYSAHYGTLVLEKLGVELVIDRVDEAIIEVNEGENTKTFAYSKIDQWERMDLKDMVLFSTRSRRGCVTVGFTGLQKKSIFDDYDFIATDIFIISPKGNNMDDKWIRQTYAVTLAKLFKDLNLDILVGEPEKK